MKDIIDSFEGMNGLLDPSKLKKSELALMENFTLKSYGNIGALVSRNGFTRYNSNQIASGGSGVGSMFEATLNGTDYIIANIINGSSSALYYEDTPYTGAWTSITGSGGSGRAYKLNYASFRDKVYIANNSGGTSSNTVWDGTTAGFYDMGCPPCNNRGITGTAETAGALSYVYWITFLYDGFQESGALHGLNAGGFQASSSAAISTSSGITISGIPTGNGRVTARKIWRCKAGETTPAYYVATITDNTTTTYTDRMPDANLADSIDPVLLGETKRPFASKYSVIHKERSILANVIDQEYTPLADTTDITFTPSDTGGSLGTGVYKYKVIKGWLLSGTILKVGQVLNKTIDMTALGYSGTDNSVVIDVSTDVDNNGWYNFIVVLRTKVGGSEYFTPAGSTFAPGYFVSLFPITDTTADASLSAPVINVPELLNYKSSYPDLISVSDAGKPDLFSTIETAQDGTLIPAGNEWNVGEPITGIHSEENRIVIFGNNNIYELDTTAQSRQFWRLNKIVSGIGADDGLQCQVGTGYCFVNTGKPEGTNSSVEKIYLWDGRSKPVSVSDKIQAYLHTNSITEYKSLTYDSANENVQVIVTNNGGTQTYVIQLDLNTSNWEIFTNTVNLDFKCNIYTKNFGILTGSGDGYIHWQSATAYRDTIAGTNRTFTTKLRTKTFEAYDRDLKPRRFRADITASGAVTPILKTAVDGTLNGGDSMTALASGFNRPNQTAFTNAQDKHYRQVYFQLEMTENVQQKVHGLLIDLDEKSEASGGR